MERHIQVALSQAGNSLRLASAVTGSESQSPPPTHNGGVRFAATESQPEELTQPRASNTQHCAETQEHTISKNRKKVSFPSDDHLLSSYAEPPHPFRGHLSSVEELVSMYQRSCVEHGTKVNPRLLQQLMAIHDCAERQETLSLRGERLDWRQCEAMEELFRRVQFRSIDFENTTFDEEGAVAILEMIEFYESTHRLVLANTKGITHRCWLTCARVVKKTPELSQLDCRQCLWPEQSLPFLGRALRLSPWLRVLHLEAAGMCGRPLAILVTALKLNGVLQELYLAENSIMPSDGQQLEKLLKFNHSLQLLDVRNNHLQDVGVGLVCDGLQEQQGDSGLQTLVLWNNQLTYSVTEKVARTLARNKHVQTLNLGHNPLTSDGLHELRTGLLANRSLLRLGLRACKLTCQGAIALAEYIADTRCLLRVDVRENDVRTAGLMALAKALLVNQSITRLDVDAQPKREPGVRDYIQQQLLYINEIEVGCVRNRERALRLQAASEESETPAVSCEPTQHVEAAEEVVVEETLGSDVQVLTSEASTQETQLVNQELVEEGPVYTATEETHPKPQLDAETEGPAVEASRPSELSLASPLSPVEHLLLEPSPLSPSCAPETRRRLMNQRAAEAGSAAEPSLAGAQKSVPKAAHGGVQHKKRSKFQVRREHDEDDRNSRRRGRFQVIKVAESALRKQATESVKRDTFVSTPESSTEAASDCALPNSSKAPLNRDATSTEQLANTSLEVTGGISDSAADSLSMQSLVEDNSEPTAKNNFPLVDASLVKCGDTTEKLSAAAGAADPPETRSISKVEHNAPENVYSDERLSSVDGAVVSELLGDAFAVNLATDVTDRCTLQPCERNDEETASSSQQDLGDTETNSCSPNSEKGLKNVIDVDSDQDQFPANDYLLIADDEAVISSLQHVDSMQIIKVPDLQLQDADIVDDDCIPVSLEGAAKSEQSTIQSVSEPQLQTGLSDDKLTAELGNAMGSPPKDTST